MKCGNPPNESTILNSQIDNVTTLHLGPTLIRSNHCDKASLNVDFVVSNELTFLLSRDKRQHASR